MVVVEVMSSPNKALCSQWDPSKTQSVVGWFSRGTPVSVPHLKCFFACEATFGVEISNVHGAWSLPIVVADSENCGGSTLHPLGLVIVFFTLHEARFTPAGQ